MLQNNTNDLYHHGIPGMKWGVRRYQNRDGSLTPAGRKRAAKLESKYQKITGKKINKKDAKKQEPTKPKTIKEMTNDELREKTTRMKLESDYINASKTLKETSPKQVSKGKVFVKKVSKDIITPVLTDVGRQLFKSFVVKTVNDSLNLDKEHKVFTNNKKKD